MPAHMAAGTKWSSGLTYRDLTAVGCLHAPMAGVDVRVRGSASRWESDDFPGWIEVSIHDSRRNEHRIVDKVPVLTLLPITSDSRFPIELWVAAEMTHIAGDEVEVALSHGLETVEGARGLTSRVLM